MIFTPEHCELILQGKKTMTRRLVKDEDYDWGVYEGYFPVPSKSVFRNNRLKWQSGKTYAIQPGRGKKSIGRIRITDIRRERLQDISYDDALAEGMNPVSGYYLRDGTTALDHVRWWKELWNSINKKKGTRWEDNPSVWCISFQLVSE